MKQLLVRFSAVPLLFFCLAGAPVVAEVRVQAAGDNLTIQANNATVAEVLAGLESALNIKIRIRGSAPQIITGSYSGPMQRVLPRLLTGVNYIVTSGADGINIIVVGANTVRSTGRAVESPSGRSAPQAAIVIADNAAESDQQGWNPSGAMFAKTAPAAPRNVVSQPPTNAAGPAGPAVSPLVGDQENNDGPQGWNPSGGMFPKLAPGAPKNAGPQTEAITPTNAAANAPSGDREDDNGPQGWNPSGGAMFPRSAPVGPNNAAGSSIPEANGAATAILNSRFGLAPSADGDPDDGSRWRGLRGVSSAFDADKILRGMPQTMVPAPPRDHSGNQ
jgi:hypothetical protein